jgi:hypothetical protein
MADFNIRSESVDVEQIMKQIRARIQEKRGVDYTEEQIRELATVRLEKFLDPKNLRSDLLEQFRRSRPAIPAEPPPIEAPYSFDDQTLFETHRGSLRFIRKLLNPLLKMFFNPNPLINVLHTQAQFNVDMLKREQRRRIEFDRSRGEWNALYYEVLHNLVLETTRSGIEIKNLKMRLESLQSRLDFSERRVRALEGVVQYRPEAVRPPRPERGEGREPREPREPRGPRQESGDTASVSEAADVAPGGGLQPQPQPGDGARRRRRRRRGRRGPGMQPGGAPEPGVDPNANTETAGDIAEGQMQGDAALDSDAGEDDREIGEGETGGFDESEPEDPAAPDRPSDTDDEQQ